MCERTTPACAFEGPNRRPASETPSAVVNVTATDAGTAAVVGADPHAEATTVARLAITVRPRRRPESPTRGLPCLLAQFQPLVPGALEELLVLLLAHLLPALLDQGRQPIAFHSVPKRFRRSTRLMR